MKETTAKIEGVVPIIPTPFHKDETIDYDALASCVRFACDASLSAVCLPAYAGEFYKLSEAERRKVIETAIAARKGKTLVIAQSNHPALLHAKEIAHANEAMGADMISFALPRIFAIPEADLFTYARGICEAVSIPVLIQDFNPGGRTIGPEFCRQLLDACPNFRYAKLEEPLLGPKLLAIRQATQDRIGVLEGWGGMYMMELMEPGICGLIPGLALADLLQKAWQLGKSGQKSRATDLFERLLPQIMFSLQNMELFLWMEKDLLVRRGIIPRASAYVRSATITPDEHTWRHALELNERIVSLVQQGDRAP